MTDWYTKTETIEYMMATTDPLCQIVMLRAKVVHDHDNPSLLPVR